MKTLDEIMNHFKNAEEHLVTISDWNGKSWEVSLGSDDDGKYQILTTDGRRLETIAEIAKEFDIDIEEDRMYIGVDAYWELYE